MGDYSSFNCNLPPGFRFYPTDEELVVHFLQRKAALLPYHPDIIPDLDLYPYNPWDLNGKAMGEGNKWYFYSRRTQLRVTGSGYWQSLGVEEPIYTSAGSKVGMKKYSSFYIGEPAEGVKTNWMMEEYSFSDSASASSNRASRSRRNSKINDYSKWVVCRVYEDDDDHDGTELSCLDEVFLSLDDLDEISFPD